MLLTLNKLEEGFELLWEGRLLAGHSSKSPLLFVGCGEGNFRMRHGSFKIKDNLKTKKEALGSYQLHQDLNGAITIKGDLAEIHFAPNGKRLEISFKVADQNLNRFWLTLPAFPGEYIYGGGEQFSVTNLMGRTLPVWCREQGVGRGRDLITFLAELTHGSGGAWHTTYFPQPTFVSSTNRYYHLDSSAYMECSFTAKGHQIHCWEVPQKIIVGQADNPPDLLEDLSDLLGRQPTLPEWAHNGVWLGIQGGREVVKSKLDDARSAGVEVAALWCQDWPGIRMTSFGKQLMWDWHYSKELYPDLSGFISELNAEGLQFLGYINPFLALEGELYKTAQAEGYLVREPGGGEYHITITDFPVALLDLTNPAAVEWIKQVIKENMIKVGQAGWMADFGEYLPTDALLHSGESAELYHNRYPAEWARVNREAIAEAGREADITFFSRAGYSGSSKQAPLIWAGDQLVNWSLDDGLASVIPAAISMGLCGIGQFHSDIGGYTTVGWIKRSKELFMRWAELSAFSAVMRTHEGNRPDANWQFNSDQETLAHFARMSKVHVKLKPYLRAMLDEYQKKGLPLLRHLWLHYPQDRNVLPLKYQYLCGRDLLVAPVYRRGCNNLGFYLPEDHWIHLWSGQTYSSGRQQVETPLGEPAVFYRAESPWGSLFAEIGAAHRAGKL